MNAKNVRLEKHLSTQTIAKRLRKCVRTIENIELYGANSYAQAMRMADIYSCDISLFLPKKRAHEQITKRVLRNTTPE